MKIEITTALIGLGGVVLGALGSIIASWLTLYYEDKREQNSKFLDNKKDLYSKLLTNISLLGVDMNANKNNSRENAMKITNPIAKKEALEDYLEYSKTHNAMLKEIMMHLNELTLICKKDEAVTELNRMVNRVLEGEHVLDVLNQDARSKVSLLIREELGIEKTKNQKWNYYKNLIKNLFSKKTEETPKV